MGLSIIYYEWKNCVFTYHLPLRVLLLPEGGDLRYPILTRFRHSVEEHILPFDEKHRHNSYNCPSLNWFSLFSYWFFDFAFLLKAKIHINKQIMQFTVHIEDVLHQEIPSICSGWPTLPEPPSSLQTCKITRVRPVCRTVRRLWKHYAGYDRTGISQKDTYYIEPLSAGLPTIHQASFSARRHYLSAGEKRRKNTNHGRILSGFHRKIWQWNGQIPASVSFSTRTWKEDIREMYRRKWNINSRKPTNWQSAITEPQTALLVWISQSCLLQPVRRQSENNGAWAHDTCCTNVWGNTHNLFYRTAQDVKTSPFDFSTSRSIGATSLQR